jgi:hypothetical protein
MATYIFFHEVDDIDHRPQSPKQQEVFRPFGFTGSSFSQRKAEGAPSTLRTWPPWAAPERP